MEVAWAASFLYISMFLCYDDGMELVTIVLLAFFGLMFGSFAGAQVWRLRARQLVEDKREGEEVDERELKRLRPLIKGSISSDRSQCLRCGKTLAWYDLLPLVSWLSTKGKCRYCRAPIGAFEPLMELGVASAFVVSYLLWPLPLSGGVGLALFGLLLVAIVLLAILFAYDLKWFLLPDVVMFPLIGVGVVTSAIRIFDAIDTSGALMSIVGAIVVLSGLYYILWFASKGQWVGFGDVKLGLALALLLADWRLALLALFLANLIGSLLVIPGMLLGRVSRKAHVPFGPLLIAGAAISLLVGEALITLYMGIAF